MWGAGDRLRQKQPAAPACLLLRAILERRECLAGEHKVALLQDVVGVEFGHRGDHHAFDVAHTRMKHLVVGRQAEQDGSPVERAPPGRGLGLADRFGSLGLAQVGPTDGSEDAGDFLGLAAWSELEAVQHDGLAVLKLGKQRHPDRGAHGLLRHRVAIVPVAPREGDAAALPLVGALGAHAGVAGSLLAEELLARAGNVGPAAGVDRARRGGPPDA